MTRSPARRAALLAALLAAGAAASAGERLDSASNAVPRSGVGAGGQERAASTSYALLPFVSEELAFSTDTVSAAYRLGAGYSQVAHQPGPVTDLAPRADAGVSSVTLTWSAPGYDGSLGALKTGTTYFLRVASYTVPNTFSDHRLADVSFSTSGTQPGAAVSAGTSGLLPNTTYWARLWTVDAAGNVSYASNISTFVTLALPPALQPSSFPGVFFTSVTAHWVARPSSPPDASSMTAEGYVLEASSTNFGGLSPGGVTVSSATAAVAQSTLTVFSPGLIVDKTYHLRVGALNWSGVPNWTQLGSTDTKFQVNDPVAGAPPFPAVSSFSLTAAWQRNGNPSNSQYHAEVSTAADFTGVVTASDTYNLFYATAGLLADTSYYFRVYASTRSNNSGYFVFPATATLSPEPLAAPGAFIDVFSSSLTLRWLPGNNPPGTSTYTVVLSTSGTPPAGDAGDVVLASTRPAGMDPVATLTGLVPNTLYFAHVAALNKSGQLTAYVVAGATATDAALPLGLALSSVQFSSATAAFTTNGNALGRTTYTVVLSTSLSYPPGGAYDASVDTVPTAASVQLALSGLQPNATYQLYVRAQGFIEDSPYASGASTATKAAAPGASPDLAAFEPVSTTGFTLNWSSGSAAEGYDVARTSYYAQVSLNAGFAPVLASSKTFNVNAAFSGLSVNTTYYARVAAYSHHHGTWTAYTDFGSSSTLAAIPAAPFTFVRVNFSSMTIRWGANGNPLPVTTYTVALSTVNSWPNDYADTVLLSTAPGGAFPSATPTGLNSGTTYYLFIAALSRGGASSAYASFGSTRTKTSPKTWIGGTGTWTTGANWSPAGVPQQTDAVTIAANVTVTADATAAISFSSLTVGDAAGTVTPTLILSTGIAKGGDVLIRRNATVSQGMATARLRVSGDWTMESGSLLTHADNAGGTLSAQLWLDVGGTFDLQPGATVSATGLGYDGGAANGGSGGGPGNGAGSSASSGGGSGAGHGGAGGDSSGGALSGGSPYDSFSDPADAGSGGGGGDRAGGGVGGSGGGVVRLSAATMNLAGRIEANGSAGAGGGASATNRGAGGGGSGGTVSIGVQTLTGGGTVYALGGDGGADADDADDPGGGGGGGRVALSIGLSGTACLINVSTSGGASGGGSSGAGTGGTFSSTATLPAPSLAAVAVTSYSVTWQWNLVSNGQDYQLLDELDGAVSPLLGSSVISYTEEGLLPHTTYTRTVRVSACGAGTSSADARAATLPSTPTVSAQPFAQVWTGSMTVTWQAFPDYPDEAGSHGYVVEASSTDFGALSPGGVVSSSQTSSVYAASLSVFSPPLLSNTTYYFRVAGLSAQGAVGPYAAMGSTPTLADLPALQTPTFTGVHFTSVTAQWANGGSAAGYILEASSTNFGAAAPGGDLASSTTWSPAQASLTASQPPLSVDTLYYLRVGALNSAGRANYQLLGGTRTRFQVNDPAPADPLFTELSSSAITARWDSNGNPADTLYHAEASADPGFSSVTSTDTYELRYASAGLNANATYYFRVFASTRSNSSGWTVLGGTMTHAPFPAMAGTPFAAVDDVSFSVRWDPGLNPPDVSSYNVVVTTGYFWPNTDAGNVILASTKPAGADPMATFTGLVPNTEYQVFVAALNWTGAPGAYAFAGSTATFPRPPAAPAFTELAYSSATVTFGLNGNVVGASQFHVVLSTVPAFPPGGSADVAVDTTPASASPALPVTGLSLDTTYYLFARTAGVAQDSAYVAGGSSVTRAAPPGPSPDVPAYEPVSTTGFTLNWSSGTAATGFDQAGTTYYAQISANAGFAPVLASSRTFNRDAGFSGLSVNTTYYARAAAFSHHSGTWTAFTDLGSTSTLAAVPAAPFTFVRVHFSSMTIRWGANGNPLTVTTYTVAMSTENAWPNDYADTVLLSTAPGGAFPSATPTGLNSGTTYYLFIAALSRSGASSAYASFGSTRTRVSPKTWVGGVDLSWQTAGNWSPAGVPQQTDAVTIAANVTVTAGAASAVSFSSLTLGDGVTSPTLILSTGIAAGQDVLIRRGAALSQGMANARLRLSGDLTMESGSLLTHADNAGATLSAQLWLDVGGTFDLQAGATVSASALGYDGGATNGGQGFGTGKGLGSSAASGGGSGAGHGGAGGAGDGGSIPGGSAYDSPTAPADAGSGGGGGDGNTGTNTGGAGGGLVRLSAATMRLDGRVEARGGDGGPGQTGATTSGAGGGGSGGAVSVSAQSFTGTGVIDVSGGAGGADADDADDPGGGGGGGRAAILITGSGVSCGLTVSATGGASGGGGSSAGSDGSYYAADSLQAATGLSGTPLSASAVQWTWSLSAGATDYQLFASTGGPMSPPLGAASVYTTGGLATNTTAAVYVQARACGSDLADSAAAETATLAVTPGAAASPFSSVGVASLGLAWTSGGNPIGVTTFSVVLSTETPFPNSDAGNIYLSTLPAGASLAATGDALDPNTTYFFFAAAMNHGGLLTSYAAFGATSTLALAPGALAYEDRFPSVTLASVTVAWGALAAAPPDASSMSCEGFLLEVSSTNFGAAAPGGLVVSSFTAAPGLGSLSVDLPDPAETTNYYRVSSVNWNGARNTLSLGKMNFQLTQSAPGVDLGALNMAVALSTVSISSIVVRNAGDLSATYVVDGDTDTAGSAWTLGTAPDVEVALLQGVWSSGDVPPPHAAFSTAITSSPRASDGAAYAGDETGLLVPPGESRTLWFLFRIPASTAENSAQRLRVTVTPARP